MSDLNQNTNILSLIGGCRDEPGKVVQIASGTSNSGTALYALTSTGAIWRLVSRPATARDPSAWPERWEQVPAFPSEVADYE